MIDLDRKYGAKEYVPTDFSPIPEGDYDLEVVEIKNWEKKVDKNVKVYMKDEKNRTVNDDKGKPIVAETIPELEYYETSVKFKVLGGDYDERLIFHNLSTHINRDFLIPAFLFGLGLDEITASQIPVVCKGKRCTASVIINTYEKEENDKVTGVPTTVTKSNNRIKTFKKPETPSNEQIPTNDLGI